MKDSKLLKVAFKNYLIFKGYGGSDLNFRKFLSGKCEEPEQVYRWVILEYKDKLSKKKEELENRNQPFKPGKDMPSHLFAKNMCNKILGTNRLF